MGKRKSSKPPPKKQRPKLEKFFSCPFCNSDKTVSAAFDWERQIGTVNCTVCQATYSTPISHLSEPIDVYSDWIDACEQENE